VSKFRVGDEVFGWCDGAFAEYAAVPETTLALKPVTLALEDAAAIPTAGFTALQALRDAGHVRSGDRVLVIGASGGVGSFAVQLAATFGARITGVCSTRNKGLVRRLGAEDVIDYTTEDFTERRLAFDLIVDLVGNRSLRECRRALTPNGTLVLVGGPGTRWLGGTGRFLAAAIASPFVSHTLRPLIHSPRQEDLEQLKALIEAGLLKPVITARYALADVPMVIDRTRERNKQGKVVVMT
jgi:NADPH:quinone reductase-like Zn-dependent oxidoreductase